MKLLILFVIYALQGKISSEETTLDPRTGDSEAPSPWLDGRLREWLPWSRIEPSCLQTSTSANSGSFTCYEVYTTQVENTVSEEFPSYVCDPGSSWAFQGPNYLDSPRDSEAPSPWLDGRLREWLPWGRVEPSCLQTSTSASSGSFTRNEGIHMSTTRESNGMPEELSPFVCEAGPSWAPQGPNHPDMPLGSAGRKKGEQYPETSSPQQKLPCEVCEKGFTSKCTLRRHMLCHSDDKPFICEVCDMSFKFKSYLMRHMGTHGDERPFPCHLCTKRFKRRSDLNDHRKIHSDERPFSCDLCTERFRRRSNLKVHLKTHSDERPFSCEICGKRYKAGSMLIQHKKTHMDERPLVCKICREYFKYKRVLERHMKLHPSNTHGLFPCILCTTRFNTMDDLRNHMSIHEGSEEVLEAQTNGGTTGENRGVMSNQLIQIDVGVSGECSYSNGVENPAGLHQPMEAAPLDPLSAVYEASTVVITGNEIVRQAIEVALGPSCDDVNTLLRLTEEEPDPSIEQTTRSASESSE